MDGLSWGVSRAGSPGEKTIAVQIASREFPQQLTRRCDRKKESKKEHSITFGYARRRGKWVESGEGLNQMDNEASGQHI